jgi:hypothetical protein
MTGDGRGVRSGIELSRGDDNAEFGAEELYEFDPMLLARTFLMLGVLAMDMGFVGRRSSLVSDGAERVWLAATSVCSRRPDALIGLEYAVDDSEYLCRVVSRGDGIVGALDRSHTAGGGDGAIVVDLKIGSAAAVWCSNTAALCLTFCAFIEVVDSSAPRVADSFWKLLVSSSWLRGSETSLSRLDIIAPQRKEEG